jgi:hypothetical protein
VFVLISSVLFIFLFLGLWALGKEGKITNWDIINPGSSTSSSFTPRSLSSLFSPKPSKSSSTVVPVIPLSSSPSTSSQKMVSVVPAASTTASSPRKSNTPRTRRSSIAMLQNLVFDKAMSGKDGEVQGKIAKIIINEIKEVFDNLGNEILQFNSYYAHSLHENGTFFLSLLLSCLTPSLPAIAFCSCYVCASCCCLSFSLFLNIGDKVSAIASLNNNRKMTERLLYLFQKDLLPGLSGEILDNKDSRDHEQLEPVLLLSKIIAWIFLGFLNMGMLFYVFLFAVEQGSSKQSAWSQTFLIWLCFDIFFISTFMVFVFHIVLPIFIKPDIMKIRKKLIESIVYYYATVEEDEKKILKSTSHDSASDLSDGKSKSGGRNGKKSFRNSKVVSVAGSLEKEEKNGTSMIPFGGSKVPRPSALMIPSANTNNSFGVEEADDDDEETNRDPSSFNAAKYLFLSYHLASRYPSLKASQIILQFHTIWPRQSYQHINDVKKAHKATRSAFMRSLSVVVMFFLTAFLTTPSFLQDMLLHFVLTVSMGYTLLLHVDLYRISPLLVILPTIAIICCLHFLYVSSKKSDLLEKIKLKRFAKRQRKIIKKHGDVRQTASFMKPLNADSSDSAWSTSDGDDDDIDAEEGRDKVLVDGEEEEDDEEEGKKKKMKSIPDYITRKQTLQQGILLSSQLQQIIEGQEEKEQDVGRKDDGGSDSSENSDNSEGQEDKKEGSLSSSSSSNHSSAFGDLETGVGVARVQRGLTRVTKTRSASSEEEESSSNESTSSSSAYEEIGESFDDDEIDHLIRRFHIQSYVSDFITKASSSVALATEDVDSFLADDEPPLPSSSEKGLVNNYINSLISRTSLAILGKKGEGAGDGKGEETKKKEEGSSKEISKEEKRKTEIKKKLTINHRLTTTSVAPVFGIRKPTTIGEDAAKETRIEALRKLKENSIFKVNLKNQQQKTFRWEKPPSNSSFKNNYEKFKKEETNNNSFFFPSHSLMKKVMIQKEESMKSNKMMDDDEEEEDDKDLPAYILEENKEEMRSESEVRRSSVSVAAEQARRTASDKKLERSILDYNNYQDQEMKEAPVQPRASSGLGLTVSIPDSSADEGEQLKDNSNSRSPDVVDGKTSVSKKSRKTKMNNNGKDSISPSSSSRKTRFERVYHQKPAFLESLHNKSKDNENDENGIIPSSSMKLNGSTRVKSPSSFISSSIKRKTNLNNTILSLNPRSSHIAATTASSALPYPSFVKSPVTANPTLPVPVASLSPTSARKPTQLTDKLSTLKRKISSFKMEVQQLQEQSGPSSASSFPNAGNTANENNIPVGDETKEEDKTEKEKKDTNI